VTIPRGNRSTISALALVVAACVLIFAPLTSAQGQQGCDGVIVLDRSISHFEAGAKHLIGIKIILHNSNATDVYDVQVRVDFTGTRGDYPPVLFTVDAIPAKNYAEIETFASYYTQPERYEVAVVGCRTEVVDPLSWLNLLHAPDSALQQVAVDASEDMTAADVPDLIAALDQRAAGNDEEAERELVEDLVLIGALARLGDARAVPAFLDAVVIYRSPMYRSAYLHLLARADAPPIPLLEEAREMGLSLEQVMLRATVALGSDAVPDLVKAASGHDPAQGLDFVETVLLSIVKASPQALLGQADEMLRHNVMFILSHSGDPAAVELLLQTALVHPGDHNEVVAAIANMGTSATDATVRALDSPDATIREIAFQALLSMSPNVAYPAVASAAAARGVNWPEGADFDQSLVVLLDGIEAEHAAQQQTWMTAATEHLGAGDCRAAYEAVEETYQVDHDLSPHRQTASAVYACLGRTLIDAGEATQACEILEEALNRQCGTSEVQGLLQEAYVAKADQAYGEGDLESADEILERALALGPSDVIEAQLAAVKLALGSAALDDRNWQSVERYYRQALGLAPDERGATVAIREAVARRNTVYLAIGLVVTLGMSALFVAGRPAHPLAYRR
jgi:Arc/MetJ family transcription regulator